MMREPLPRGGTIGILGGGQLGRMLAQAAAKLGFRTCVLSPERDSPAFDVSAERICAAYDDGAALRQLASTADVVTFEFENVSAEALALLEGATHVAPSRRALEITQDRLKEKDFLNGLGLPTAPFITVESAAALSGAVDALQGRGEGGAVFLKLARQGYDGKGQFKIGSRDALSQAEAWLGDERAVLEQAIAFDMELSVVAVRAAGGEMLFYDVPQNLHRDGVLRESIVPARIAPSVRRDAETYAQRIAEALGYVGVLAVEMFLLRQHGGFRLLVNEIAPRVHNSGHWTTEACAVGQFENHIRAIAGWPLGATWRHSDARMINLLGKDAEDALALVRADPRRSLHLYGKREARPARKMGHYVELGPRTEGQE